MSANHCIRWMRRLAISAAIPAFLTACGYEGGAPALSPGQQIEGKPLYGLERGSRLETVLSGNDREAIAEAAGSLLASGESGAVRPWTTGSGNSGQLTLGTTYLIGLDSTSGAPIAAPAGIDVSVPLSPSTSNLVTTKNANIRLGAAPTANVNETVSQGTILRSYGYDRTGDWYLVGAGEGVDGYVSGQVVKETSGGAPLLAGGSPKRPQLCRDISLSLTTADSRTDSWTSFVCQSDTGWQVPAERGLS